MDYEEAIQHHLTGLRSLWLQKDYEAWQGWEDETRSYLRLAGKTLEDFSSSEEELKQLRCRTEVLRKISIGCATGLDGIIEIVDSALGSVGTNFEELWQTRKVAGMELSGIDRRIAFSVALCRDLRRVGRLLRRTSRAR